MKKIKVMLCALVLCLLNACVDACGLNGDANTTYTWSYSNNGTTGSGEFTTNEYGQASFDVPDGTDCSKVNVQKKEPPLFD